MDDLRITKQARAIKVYIDKVWGRHFTTELERPLRCVFPEPESNGLRHIWRYGSADLVIYREGKPIAVIETGGAHHFEEKQSRNDRRKWKLCEINNVRCLTMMNGLMERLSKRQWRNMVGRYLFGVDHSSGQCSSIL